MSEEINPRHQFEACVEVFDNIAACRAAMAKGNLTAEVIDQLNGEDHGLENLLGHPIMVDFDDAEATSALRIEINKALEAVEETLPEQLHAALECYIHDLVSACSEFDAMMEENLNIRHKLIEKINSMTDEEKEQYLEKKCEFECFSFQACKDVCDTLANIGHFLETKDCDFERLKELSTTQGNDMSKEDRDFLLKLMDLLKNDDKICCEFMKGIRHDRQIGASLKSLGFDCDKIAVLAKNLIKAEEMFFATVRPLREIMVHDTDTVAQIAVKNSLFWDVMDHVGCKVKNGEKLRRCLSEQLALMYKLVLGADNASGKSEGDDPTKGQGGEDLDKQKTEEQKKEEQQQDAQKIDPEEGKKSPADEPEA